MTPRVPGVHREDVLPSVAPAFRSGVPAFLAPLPPGEPLQLATAGHLAPLRPLLGHSHVPAAVDGFFSAGGRLCYLVPFGASAGDHALADALARIDALDDVDLIAAPDPPIGDDALRRAQVRLLAAVDGTTRVCLLDVPAREGRSAAVYLDAVAEHARALAGQPGADNAALYFPWLGVGGRVVPPCGHVAGVISATDARAGAHKAPAGEPLRGVVDLDVALTPASERALADLPINWIRAQPGRGLWLWGARTLGQHPARRALAVRRLILTIRRHLEQLMDHLAFEPSDAWLWGRIAREAGAYLQSLYERGALGGARPDEAYFVRCDESTNPPELRDLGLVHAEIGVAPAATHEFIVLRLRVDPQARAATLDENSA